ncbi:cytochrome c3 family protein [Ferrimonas marina]|uniref:Putative redox-active protein (C_GCAxxG_C_C) n=1 Tax=Ferrimonas marina TaxID=299255 RepID=A0A1M5X1B9_9GAMM|nr:C-GCAxxG-C-C family (seleno)protein [Ferrimonas marina]SHH93676.1 Putative redox-active protein (C_GCAxxG_C_C) [Ferrimonas marina]
MTAKIDRRKAMGQILGIAGGAGAALAVPSVFANEGGCGSEIGIGCGGNGDLGQNLLQYVKLDPMAVAKTAYEGYGNGGCMYGVFHAIVKELAKSGSENAENFAAIPTNISAYGGGGIAGWGTLCGCVNATAMAVNMLDGVDRPNVIRAVFRYYESADMPRGDKSFLDAIGAPTRFNGNDELLTPEHIKSSVAQTILCHASVSRWSKESGYGSNHQAKLERCAQVTAEIAYQTVVYLNASLEQNLDAPTQSPDNGECMACHGGTDAEREDYFFTDVNSQMECSSCHTPHKIVTEGNPHNTCSDCH